LATTIQELCEEIRASAHREEFPIDVPVYERFQKDPFQPILYAGSLEAAVCIFGRDLGKDEVRLGQPLIGAGGKLVRQGLRRALQAEGSADVESPGEPQIALGYALLTNTVPYKPPGNKAYSDPVKQRFRPLILELLTRFWTGHHIIPLGTESFRWFEPYGDVPEFRSRGRSAARFDSLFPCRLPVPGSEHSRSQAKLVSVMPLPHPSPLNRRWLGEFPTMLVRMLSQIRPESGGPDL
jgi:uracil-DNA glycosylase